MRYIITDWYQWHDTHASLVVQVDWHRLLVPENWSVCMALYTLLLSTVAAQHRLNTAHTVGCAVEQASALTVATILADAVVTPPFPK